MAGNAFDLSRWGLTQSCCCGDCHGSFPELLLLAFFLTLKSAFFSFFLLLLDFGIMIVLERARWTHNPIGKGGLAKANATSKSQVKNKRKKEKGNEKHSATSTPTPTWAWFSSLSNCSLRQYESTYTAEAAHEGTSIASSLWGQNRGCVFVSFKAIPPSRASPAL